MTTFLKMFSAVLLAGLVLLAVITGWRHYEQRSAAEAEAVKASVAIGKHIEAFTDKVRVAELTCDRAIDDSRLYRKQLDRAVASGNRSAPEESIRKWEPIRMVLQQCVDMGAWFARVEKEVDIIMGSSGPDDTQKALLAYRAYQTNRPFPELLR